MPLVDYAWQKPTPAQIIGAGFTGVLRYLSNDPSKNLSAGERDALLAAGLAIGLVWETTATRAGQGYSAGQQDVQVAEAQADALGYPVGCPIFYAVDFDATVSAVLPYFQGVQGLSKRPVGVYGSANVIEGVPVPWKWQTIAWSHGRVSSQAHIYQTLQASLPGCDFNEYRSPVPLWGGAASGSGGIVSGMVTVPGAPNFPTNPTSPTQEEDMSLVTFNVSDGTRDVAVAGRIGDVIGVFGSTEELQAVQVAGAANPGEVNTRQLDLYHQWWARSTSVASLEAQIAALATPTVSGADVAQSVVAALAAKLA